MQLLVILAALGLLHYLGAGNPIHRDTAFGRWLSQLEALTFLRDSPQLIFVLGIVVPVLILALALEFLGAWMSWLGFVLSAVVLFYSLRWEGYDQHVATYLQACSTEDWSAGVAEAKCLGVATDHVATDAWAELHDKVLDEAAYEGFERMFAVLFWFLLLGPVGALIYRLSFVYVVLEKPAVPVALRWLWLLEWPAVRVLGLSFAVTGNFLGCYQRWRECFMCAQRSTKEVLKQSILGALSVDEELTQTCDVTRRELKALKRLFNRTLWLWLGIIAIATLYG